MVMTLMRYLLIYDISHDGTRTKVADACLDYGLERIQYSAFFGELNRTHQHELWQQIKRRIGKHTAVIHLYPLDEKSWTGRRILDQSQGDD
jgi:CRISPR-associated protein Cas2